MPPAGWHLKFAQQMIDLADSERNKNPWVAFHAILRAFEEIIDAYGAEEGFHFHDAYPIEGWHGRMRWMCDSKPDLLEEWNDLTGSGTPIQAGQSDHTISQMSKIVRNRLRMMRNHYTSDDLPDSDTTMTNS